MRAEWQKSLEEAHQKEPKNPFYSYLIDEDATEEEKQKEGKKDVAETLKYAKAQGTVGLRSAAAKIFTQDTGIEVADGDVAVGAGGKGALNGVVRYLQPGDRVLVASTGWPTNYDMFPAGVQIIEVDSHGLGLLTPEEVQAALKAHPDAKMFLINSPCNPTGKKYSTEEREEVMGVLKTHVENLLATAPDEAPAFQVVMDDPYARLVFDNSNMKRGANETALVKDGFLTTVRYMSKEYGMAGTRIGFAITKNQFIKNHVVNVA
jgi:aspartate/methionine/tyrosine aminotransferase